MRLGSDDLVQLENVAVMQGTMMVDLAGELARHVLGNLLYRTSGARQTVSGNIHGTIGA